MVVGAGTATVAASYSSPVWLAGGIFVGCIGLICNHIGFKKEQKKNIQLRQELEQVKDEMREEMQERLEKQKVDILIEVQNLFLKNLPKDMDMKFDTPEIETASNYDSNDE